jgi:hypothetical protein
VTKNGIAIGNKIPIELTAKTTIGKSEQQSNFDYHARATAHPRNHIALYPRR